MGTSEGLKDCYNGRRGCTSCTWRRKWVSDCVRAFVLYVNEELNLSFKVIRLAEVAVNTCNSLKSSAHQLNHILNSDKNMEGPVT